MCYARVLAFASEGCAFEWHVCVCVCADTTRASCGTNEAALLALHERYDARAGGPAGRRATRTVMEKRVPVPVPVRVRARGSDR